MDHVTFASSLASLFILAVTDAAAIDEPGFLTTLLGQVWLWTKVALGIGLVIFVHELGHFLAAKTFGVKCEKFYVGFDVPIQIGPIKLPRTLGKFQYGETEYGIGILPLGGYVKMLGQDDDPRNAEKEAQRIKLGETGGDTTPRLDPRSFPAKPVWQRMIIISAGVVVNVITGVMFAAMAFGFGVPYMPAVVGNVTPGGPAWRAGVQPGGKILSVGEFKPQSDLHFEDMQVEVMTAGLKTPDQPIDVVIDYPTGPKQYQLSLQSFPGESDRRMIGIGSARAATLNPKVAALPGSAAAAVLTPADRGATITRIDDVVIDPAANQPAAAVLAAMIARADQPLELTLQRPESDASPAVTSDRPSQDVRITLPPQPMRSLGIGMKIGPVTALVDGGAAQQAGVRVGDRIIAVDGSTDVDAYSFALQSQLDDRLGKDVQLTLERDTESGVSTIDVALRATDTPGVIQPVSPEIDSVSVTSLGLAFRPLPIVARVGNDLTLSADVNNDANDDGPVAADSTTLRTGDVIQEVRVVWPDNRVPESIKEEFSEEGLRRLTGGWDLAAPGSLNTFTTLLQILPAGTKFRVFVERPDTNKIVSGEVTSVAEPVYWFERGLNLMPIEDMQRADSIGHAVALGLGEGKRRFGEVLGFLRMLVSGQIKPKFIGGPIRIVQMAGVRAEQGISKQLLFLTMLSMNLAIINFLPIPALDGGHMVFLTAELIRGKRVDEQLEMKLTLAGVLAILALMIFVFANDIWNLG